MNMQELILKFLSENKLIQKDFIKEIEEEINVSMELPEDESEIKKIVLEYLNAHGVELNQTNYDYVLDLLSKNEDKNFHEVVKKKKQVNTLEEYSLEELKDILQLYILRQCESIYKLIESFENVMYEYAIERIMDAQGSTDVRHVSDVMNSYANKGWRVKTVFTNELGHNSSEIGIGGIRSGVNYTSDEVVIIFERRKAK